MADASWEPTKSFAAGRSRLSKPPSSIPPRRYNPAMADWLFHSLVQIGGTAALLIGAGLWLWRKIDKALESYSTAYANGQAAIDVRIRNLEKLAEEQARLTRIVEGIKDEIGAQRRLENNRWDFKREVYLNLVTLGFELLGHLDNTQQFLDEPTTEHQPEPLNKCLDSFTRYACIAELATADELKPVLDEIKDQLTNTPDMHGPGAAAILKEYTAHLRERVVRIRTAGRKELWGDSDPKAEVAKA